MMILKWPLCQGTRTSDIVHWNVESLFAGSIERVGSPQDSNGVAEAAEHHLSWSYPTDARILMCFLEHICNGYRVRAAMTALTWARLMSFFLVSPGSSSKAMV